MTKATAEMKCDTEQTMKLIQIDSNRFKSHSGQLSIVYIWYLPLKDF